MVKLLITVLSLVVLGIYLFVNAPPPLVAETKQTHTLPLRNVLAILEDENDVARELYTNAIVGVGTKKGIKFSEEWAEDDLHAGPLPAQFLRETSRSLESNPVPLGLFLGSDHAINKANSFEGKYLEMFAAVRHKRDAIYFYVEDSQRYAYMAPDVAIVKPCVTCHNDHEESPKTDWRLDDVMGATTWTYPNAKVGYKETINMVQALRKGFRDAYQAFLNEAQKMEPAPEIGERWPSDGFYLPSVEVFMAELEQRSSANVVSKLIQAGELEQSVAVAAN